MKTYKTLWSSEQYSIGIYSRCQDMIELRSDGQRARINRDVVRWRGNTGHLAEAVTYVDGRQAVRALVRRLRQAQIAALRHGDPKNHYELLYHVLGAKM